MTTNNHNHKSITETVLLEHFDIHSGIGLMLSELDNNKRREFNLHLFEGYTQKSINSKTF